MNKTALTGEATSSVEREIEGLSRELNSFLIEECNTPFAAPQHGSPLHPLFVAAENLRQKYMNLLQESESQTLSEGEFELKRRQNMGEISAQFETMVGGVVSQLTQRGSEVSEASDNAMQAGREVSTSVEDIERSIKAVLERASISGQMVDTATTRAQEAAELTKKLNISAQEIVDVVDLIQSIAKQTDLLALNAGIEAARAGDVGRGFGVVALEVKNLALRTTEAAQQVRRTVSGMSQVTQTMTQAVDAIKDANSQVADSTEGMIEAVNKQADDTTIISDRVKASNDQMVIAEDRIQAIRNEAALLNTQTSEFVGMISAEPGVTNDEVYFGQSAPYTGAVSGLGLGTKHGIELAFSEAAALGGIHGRNPILVGQDDGYNPKRALENVRQFVRGGKILGLVGAVGTPTSKLSERIARGGRVPFIGPVTGTSFLRDKSAAHVINTRASYADEAAALVRYYANTGKLDDIAFFCQADAYGQAVRDALKAPLAAHGADIRTYAQYNRDTGDISAASKVIIAARPALIFMAGTAKPTADFVKSVRDAGIDTEFATISFVGSTEFARQAGAAGAGVVVSQVVPLPDDRSFALPRAFRKAFDQFGGRYEPDFAMLEGYLTGRVICEMLQRAGRALTRDGFLATLMGRSTNLNIDGFNLEYGPGNNRGTKQVSLTTLQASGRYQLASSGNTAQRRTA